MRCNPCRYLVFAIAAGLVVFLFLVLFPVPSHADERVARHGRDEAHFTDEPCSYEKVLRFLTPDQAKAMHNATVHFQGKDYQACYVEAEQGFLLRFEDGDIGGVGKRDLLPGV